MLLAIVVAVVFGSSFIDSGIRITYVTSVRIPVVFSVVACAVLTPLFFMNA